MIKIWLRSFGHLVSVQFKEYWREPGVLFWTLGFPVAVAWLLGLSFTAKPEIAYRIAVVGESLQASRLLEQKEVEITLPGSKGIEKLSFIKMSLEEAMTEISQGKILVIVEPSDTEMIYHLDPQGVEAKTAYLWLKQLDTAQERHRVEPISRKGARYIDFLVPGLLALGIMNSTLWGIGWTLIEFRMKKFLRRMIATPLNRFVFMASLWSTRAILGLIEAAILLIFVRIFFDLQIAGGLGLFLMSFFAGHIAFTGIAIFIASRTSNSRVGNGIINAVTIPMFLLSGVFFSYQNFPDWMITFVQYLPATILADTMRGIFQGTIGFAGAFFPSVWLFLLGLVFYTIGIRIYRWY